MLIDYITQLWKDTKDIEFVKEIIGHRRLDTTFAYVNKLSDQVKTSVNFSIRLLSSEKHLGFDLSTSNNNTIRSFIFMYYNKILRVWAVDQLDCFLLSAILGSIVASLLKDYLSEKKAMKRLKNSSIEKSKLVIKSDRPMSNSKKVRIRKIYNVALGNRGGQFENFQANHEFSHEVFKLAQEIKGLVERLASFLKERELKGVARIFFKNVRLLLELILYR